MTYVPDNTGKKLILNVKMQNFSDAKLASIKLIESDENNFSYLRSKMYCFKTFIKLNKVYSNLKLIT